MSDIFKQKGVLQSRYLPVLVLIGGYLFVVAHYFNEIRAGGEPWKSGDWLINYQGGFVRRGALGELLLKFSDLAQFDLLWLLFTLQVAVYSLVIYFTCQIYVAVDRSKEWAVILLSPAFLMFAFYDYLGGFRKEIIAFAAFAILAHGYASLKVSKISLGVALGLFALGSLSHELVALTCPFFLYLTYLVQKRELISRPLALISYCFYIGLSALSLWFGLRFYGDVSVAKMICESLVLRGIGANICLGSIDSLSIHYNEGVWAKIPHFLWVYLPVFALAVTPILVSDWLKKDPLSKLIVLVGFVALLPLYAVAYDWGRWIHIYLFFVTILLLAQSCHVRLVMPALPRSVLIFYLTLWMIPTLYASGNTTNGLLWRVVGVFKRLSGY
jgi:hypothetical protein